MKYNEVIEMKAVKSKNNSNNLVIPNFKREAEEPVFEKIKAEFIKNPKITVEREINGPFQDIIESKCNDDEVTLCYDYQFGLCPIRCTETNVDIIMNIINDVMD